MHKKRNDNNNQMKFGDFFTRKLTRWTSVRKSSHTGYSITAKTNIKFCYAFLFITMDLCLVCCHDFDYFHDSVKFITKIPITVVLAILSIKHEFLGQQVAKLDENFTSGNKYVLWNIVKQDNLDPWPRWQRFRYISWREKHVKLISHTLLTWEVMVWCILNSYVVKWTALMVTYPKIKKIIRN
jgi:hypothetical protein